jgi:hypothetical protein
LRLTASVVGDTAECGAFKGASSYLIWEANKRSKPRRIHHIFDSFEGVSAPTSKDSDYWTKGDRARKSRFVY